MCRFFTASAVLVVIALVAGRFAVRHRAEMELHTSPPASVRTVAEAPLVIDRPRLPISEPSTQTAKLWVNDWPAFLNSTSEKGWMRVGSTNYWATENEARTDARWQAARALAPSLLTQVRSRMANRPAMRAFLTNDWIVERCFANTTALDLAIADEYVQRLDRPYGQVWSSTLLINPSPQVTDKLVRTLNEMAQQQFKATASNGIALAALFLVIALLYVFLNAVTKGYFMWRLRAIATLGLIAAVLMLFALP